MEVDQKQGQENNGMYEKFFLSNSHFFVQSLNIHLQVGVTQIIEKYEQL
jgi:hypothetical protein